MKTRRPAWAMNRLAFVTVILAAIAVSAGAQDNSMSGSGNDMMGKDMSYNALKKSGMLADTKMGNQLRLAQSTGMKTIYTDLKSAQALAANNPTVLFFAADWCPSCQMDLKDINANGSRLGKVNVVVVDYDKSASLKARYGVTVQDTFVQIDAKGARLGIWNEGGVDGVLQHVKESM
ncbi:MAG: thioredoxin family protein [Spirochaetia bacterium]